MLRNVRGNRPKLITKKQTKSGGSRKTTTNPNVRNGRKTLQRALMRQALAPRQAGFARGTMEGAGDYDEIVSDLANTGAKAIRQLGGWLSGKAKSFFGLGDYSEFEENGTLKLDDSKINSNSLIVGTSPPTIRNKGQAFVMRHREYVGDVVPSTNFTNSSYLINPGNSKLFPWLSGITDAFEEYQITGMIVEYKPLVSAVSANSIGAVIISTEYNPTKPNFTTKAQMENYEYATSCAPHHCMLHAIECDPMETVVPHKQVLFGNLPQNQDARMYYWGNLQVATQGQANSTGVIGELWVTYEILCYKPIFAIGQGLNLQTDHFAYLLPNPGTTALLAFSAADYGTPTILPNPGSLLGSNIDASGTINFPNNIYTGYWLVTISVEASANFTSSSSLTANNFVLTNCTFVKWLTVASTGAKGLAVLPGELPANASAFAISGGWIATTQFIVSVSAPSSTFATIQPILSAGLGNTGSLNVDVLVTQVNGALQ